MIEVITRQVLQSATIITKCSTIQYYTVGASCDRIGLCQEGIYSTTADSPATADRYPTFRLHRREDIITARSLFNRLDSWVLRGAADSLSSSFVNFFTIQMRKPWTLSILRNRVEWQKWILFGEKWNKKSVNIERIPLLSNSYYLCGTKDAMRQSVASRRLQLERKNAQLSRDIKGRLTD